MKQLPFGLVSVIARSFEGGKGLGGGGGALRRFARYKRRFGFKYGKGVGLVRGKEERPARTFHSGFLVCREGGKKR